MKPDRWLAATAVCGVSMFVACQAQAQAPSQSFRIPPGNLSTTLDAYVAQSRIQLIYSPDQIGNRRSPGAVGVMTNEAALRSILAGSGLVARRDSSGAYAIVPEERHAAKTVSMLADPPPAPTPESAPQASSDEKSGKLEEIIVTARRTSERLIDVPVAVTALSAQTLERAHVSDLSQIAQLTPNLIVASATAGTGGAIAIRGVASSFLDPGVEQSVGLNIDGVSIGRAYFINASQFDLAQVEVLKGPQALFFGKNSPAGVVSITSAMPTARLSAMARVGYEFDAKERFAEGYVSGPLSDTLGFRVAVKYSKLDGWIKNSVPPTPAVFYPGFTIPGPSFTNTPNTEQLAGRVTLQWKPTSDFTATLKVSGNRVRGDSADSSESFCAAGSADAQIGKISTFNPVTGQFVVDPYSDCNLDRHSSTGRLPNEFQSNWPFASKNGGLGYSEVRTWIASLNLQYQMGPLTLTSITGYTNLFAANYFNATRDFQSTLTAGLGERDHTISEEVRVQSSYDGPVNFTIGGFFEDAHRNNPYNSMFGFVGFDAANGNSVTTFKNDFNATGKTYSLFGQLRWKIVDPLELSAGVRYTHETKGTTFIQEYLNPLGVAFGFAPAGSTLDVHNSFSNWSPEITLRYKPTDNVMAYVAYKTGYKSGGISATTTISAAQILDPSPLKFNPEISRGFEAGIKAQLLNRTLRFDLTAYRYEFTDLQLTSIQNTAFSIRNAGKARTTGIEGSIVWQATPELSLHGNGAYNDAKFVSYQGAQCYALIARTAACPGGSYDRSGQPLQRAPKGTFAGGFDYTGSLGQALKFGFGAEAVHTSKYFIHENGDPNLFQDAFWRLNANARIGGADDRWELELIGRNLTNEYIKVVGLDKTFGKPGTYTVYSLRPREIVLQGTVRF